MATEPTITQSNIPHFTIHSTTADDVPLILDFIIALADHYQIANKVKATEQTLQKTLFGPKKFATAVIGYYNQEAVAFALFYPSFLTLVGRPGIYLECLYVKPTYRYKGFGKAIIVYLAQLAKKENFVDIEWRTPAWNDPAISFYRRIGATPVTNFMTFTINGKKLQKLVDGG